MAQGADINWTNPDKNGITCLMRATFNENGPPRVAMVQVSFQFTQIYKNNVIDLLIFGRKFGFMGPFMMPTKFGPKNYHFFKLYIPQFKNRVFFFGMHQI